MDVVGTGGAWRIWAISSGSLDAWPLTISKKRQAWVARGWPVKGVPSVMTQRVSSGQALASSRA